MSETELTEADKRKIEEEERYRARVKEDLGQFSKQQKHKRRRNGCLTVIIVFIALAAFGNVISSPDKKEETGEPTPVPVIQRDFNASVNFTGTQFVITNLDDLDCQNAHMEINFGVIRSGYSLEGYTLEVGKIYTVGAMQFTEKDGTRFNPLEKKPQSFYIRCGGSNALDGASYAGEFN